jgi:hypothetical protein
LGIIKPTVTAVAFALLSWRLDVASWPLTIAFSLTFFIHGVVAAYLNSVTPGSDLAKETPGIRAGMLYVWATFFSPISLWAPVLFGTSAYALARRLRSNNRWRGP